jgi:UrcA family protein
MITITSESFRTLKVWLLSAALLAASASLAPAGEFVSGKPETASATVVLADLDLSTPSGIAESRKRLTIVSERLCRNFWDHRKVDNWENYLRCVKTTLASAVERMQTSTSNVAKN